MHHNRQWEILCFTFKIGQTICSWFCLLYEAKAKLGTLFLATVSALEVIHSDSKKSRVWWIDNTSVPSMCVEFLAQKKKQKEKKKEKETITTGTLRRIFNWVCKPPDTTFYKRWTVCTSCSFESIHHLRWEWLEKRHTSETTNYLLPSHLGLCDEMCSPEKKKQWMTSFWPPQKVRIIVSLAVGVTAKLRGSMEIL